MPKRSSTDSQADSSSSEIDEIDQKPDLSDSHSEDYKPATSPKKKAKPSSKKKKDDDKPKQLKTKWTEDEDQVFVSLMEAHLRATFWQAVKDDGRLTHRGGNGIKAHVIAFLNKAKKG